MFTHPIEGCEGVGRVHMYSHVEKYRGGGEEAEGAGGRGYVLPNAITLHVER